MAFFLLFKENMKNPVSNLACLIGGALRALPAEFLALMVSAVSVLVLHQFYLSNDNLDIVIALTKTVFLGILSTPLFFSLSIAAKHSKITEKQKRVFSMLVLFPVGFLLWGITTNHPDIITQHILWIILPTAVSSFCVPFVTSALVSSKNDRFESCSRFIRVFFESLTLWGLCWVAAAGAIVTVFASIGALFDVANAATGGFQFLVIVTVFFVLSFLHKILHPSKEYALPVFWKKVTTLVGAPFVASMLFLFLIYEVSLLLKGELPQNMLSPLIIGCGFVGFMCTLIFQSIEMTSKPGHPSLYSANRDLWLKALVIRISRAFPFLMTLLLPLAIWALVVRITEYGLTPFRLLRLWMLLFLSLTSIFGGIRWLKKEPPLSWETPAFMAIFGLLFSVGPLNARRLSIKSQAALFKKDLLEVGIVDLAKRSVTADFAKINWEHSDKLSKNLKLILELGGQDDIAKIVGNDKNACLDPHETYQCLMLLGFSTESDGWRYKNDEETRTVQKPYLESHLSLSGASLTTFGTVEEFYINQEMKAQKVGDALLYLDEDDLTLELNNKVVGKQSIETTGLCDSQELERTTHSFQKVKNSQINAEIAIHNIDRKTYKTSSECSFDNIEGLLIIAKQTPSSKTKRF